MKKAIVVGTGAGGATAAKELQGTFDVTMLEAGKEFRPFRANLARVEKLKKRGLMFDEREIQFLFPAMKIRKTEDRVVVINGIGLGGTTTLATGNALRMDGGLRKLGIDLDAEFEELYREVPVSTRHQRRWRATTQRLFQACNELGLAPQPLPKMGDHSRCINCGRCVFGCDHGAKWDSRQFVGMAIEQGAQLTTNARVEKVVIKDGAAVGVISRQGWRSMYYPADLVILAAGGLGTPIILEQSGIKCESSLFVDPVLCAAVEWKCAFQNHEIAMPFVVQRNGFIVSPYFDYLSFFFNREWNYPADDTLSIMVKIADTAEGEISKKGIRKTLNDEDRNKFIEGAAVCFEVFGKLGIDRQKVFMGTVNAGHPGGMLPLTQKEAKTFHHDHLPENLYVADATLFPSSLGNPPIFTIMAMAKRIGKLCRQKAA
ncbi:MAG TPA: GMC family oxidoreductase N-terminal domain-containing protein [Bacteroidota bacterium]|nr:GMC family oxidoreductase N-terminal domain-containing protein [Bacteroidota bacterium]